MADSTSYTHDNDRWYPTTPAEYGRMLAEEAERQYEQARLSLHYGELMSVSDRAELIAKGYETRTGPGGMEYRRKPPAVQW